MDQSADFILLDLGYYSRKGSIPKPVWAKAAFLPVDNLGVDTEVGRELRRRRVGNMGTLLLYTLDEIAALCGEEAGKEVDRCLREYGIRSQNADVLAGLKEEGYWVELVDEDGGGKPCNLRIVTWLLQFVEIEEIHALHMLGPSFFQDAGILTVEDLLRAGADGVSSALIAYSIRDYPESRTLQKRLEEGRAASEKFLKIVSWMRSSGLSFAE